MKKDTSIKKGYQIKWLLRNGKDFNSENIRIKIIKNNKRLNRFAVILKKGIKGSVIRNNIKRKAREAYRLALNKLQTGFDIIIVIQKPINAILLRNEILSLLRGYIVN